jgi:two-component system CheB/CheR fusion protein
MTRQRESSLAMPGDDTDFEQILEHLQQTRGFDFTAYKRTSLVRRVRKRMEMVKVPTFEAYLDYLQVHQDEFAALFNTILINVTSFFRDRDVWDALARNVLPALAEQTDRATVLRAWSAGCASGQEAYSLAMLLAEVFGLDALRNRVKIYATDVDDEALNEARTATYAERHVADVPPRLLEKYFDRSGSQYSVNRELRRTLIFGRHDLLQDAPISRVDLLLCRNTLMYFQADAQARILARFYFSLKPTGYILLGRAEMLFSHGAMFTPVDLKRRLFKPVPKPNQRDRLLLMAQTGRDIMMNHRPGHAKLREAAFESDSVPQIVLDANGTLAAANAPARLRFGLSDGDVGRPIQDLEVSFRPTDLRSPLQQALQDAREVVLKDVPWSTDGATQYVEIVVTPLHDDDRSVIGTCISFHDVTGYKALQQELQHSKQELETAYEELQSTNEELETTNEELQSTVEELETTNEELQSTNEELETMNEELQSTNEELQTMNDEMRNQSADLNAANVFLESVFASLRSGVVVLDREYRVQVWNQRATDLWGLRQDEVQQSNFLSLDIGLPIGELREPIRQVLADGSEHQEVTIPATNRRGRAVQCRITLSPLKHANTPIGVMLLMDELD